MSGGKLSLNECTRRGSHWPARLADVASIVKFCNFFFRNASPEQRDDGLWIFKFDAVTAYRQVPIPEAEYHLTACIIDRQLYVNTRLMMGACASGDIMSHTVSIMRDVLAAEGIFSESFVDDHVILSPHAVVGQTHTRALQLWDESGYQQQHEKFEKYGIPQRQCEVFGVMIDPSRRLLWITESRARKIIDIIDDWLRDAEHPRRRRRTSREYSSLAGKLFFISQTFPLARAFVGSLYRFSTMVPDPSMEDVTNPSLDLDVLADLVWWRHILSSDLPVVSFADTPRMIRAVISSDASNTGYGAVCDVLREYIHGTFDSGLVQQQSILHREAFVIGLGVGRWNRAVFQEDSVIVFVSDSEPCVTAFNAHKCRDFRLRFFMRIMCMLQMYTRVPIRFTYIPTSANIVPDALSRNGSNIPSQLIGYTPATPTPSWQAFLQSALLKWHSAQSTNLSRMTLLYELLTSTVQSVASPGSWNLPWTRWSDVRGDYLTLRVGCTIPDASSPTPSTDTFQQ